MRFLSYNMPPVCVLTNRSKEHRGGGATGVELVEVCKTASQTAQFINSCYGMGLIN